MGSIFKAVIVFLLTCNMASAQDATELVHRLKQKLDRVNDYQASGILKTDVAFIKVPVSNVDIFYKKPDRFKIKKEGGIAILPKGGVSININSILVSDKFTAVPAGSSSIGNTVLTIVKLLPMDEASDIVLTTLYIDEKNLVVRRAITTTRESGTYEMELSYGKYSDYGLPDKVVFLFNTKDYKIPKGVTFEYDEDEAPKADASKIQNKKGKVEITYNSYTINKGLTESVFN